MKLYNLIAIFLVVSVSCVQIPQESVQLSKMMGEDLKEIYRAHISLVNLHYDDLEGNINNFVDQVYAPYQTGKLVEADIEDMKRGVEDTMSGSLAEAPNNPEAAEKALEFMGYFIRFVREDIENYRKELLNPIQAQRQEVLNQLHASYANVMSANASITAHMSSLIKVKETQSELLEKLGYERKLNEEMGKKIADLSGQVKTIIDKAYKIDQKSDKAIDQFNGVKNEIINLIK